MGLPHFRKHTPHMFILLCMTCLCPSMPTWPVSSWDTPEGRLLHLCGHNHYSSVYCCKYLWHQNLKFWGKRRCLKTAWLSLGLSLPYISLCSKTKQMSLHWYWRGNQKPKKTQRTFAKINTKQITGPLQAGQMTTPYVTFIYIYQNIVKCNLFNVFFLPPLSENFSSF